jgi:hypothetical protein
LLVHRLPRRFGGEDPHRRPFRRFIRRAVKRKYFRRD